MKLHRRPAYGREFVPDVKGMGARDAVYIMESRGIRVRVKGRGKVLRQSVQPGYRVKKNMVCEIELG